MSKQLSRTELEKRVQELQAETSRRRQAEAALEKERDFLKMLLEAIPLPLFHKDEKGRYTGCNRAFEELIGVSRSQITGRTIYELSPGEIAGKCDEKDQALLKNPGEQRCQTRVKNLADGQAREVIFDKATVSDADGAVKGLIGIISDVTDRKEAELKLRKSEEKFRLLFQNSPVGIFLSDSNGRLLDANPEMARIFGYGSPEAAVAGIHDIGAQVYVHPDRRRELLHLLKENGTVENFEHEGVRRDGSPMWVSINARIRKYLADGSFLIEGFAFDVTERKLGEKALQESEEKYRLLVENASDGIFIAQDGVMKFPNRKTEELTGYSASELARMPFTDFIVPADQEEILANYQRRLAGEKHPKNYAVRAVNRKGEEKVVNLNTVFIEWENRPAALVFMRDITQQRKLEIQVQMSQRLEAIGTLAGGIAHDFNNILFPIIGYVEILKEELAAQTPAQNYLDNILKAAFRARDLVMQILSFSRQTEMEKRPVKPHLIIKEALKLIRSSIPASISIRMNEIADCGLVMCDPTQVHQIIMNLATNAYHAIGENVGEIGVALEKTQVAPEDPHAFDTAPGSYVCIRVSDTGCGMSREILDRMFDPYFTTWEIGKGTGLGLSVVHGIVKSCGGFIQVYSEFGCGSEFRVYLPVVECDGRQTLISSPEEIPGGTERILFVDDEEEIIKIGKKSLESLGYRVAARASSIDALEAFRHHPAGFDLVITDLTMPNMTGLQLAQAVRAIRPEIPIILATGFSTQTNEEKAQAMGIDGVLLKPVVKKEMAAMIRKVLDGRTSH